MLALREKLETWINLEKAPGPALMSTRWMKDALNLGTFRSLIPEFSLLGAMFRVPAESNRSKAVGLLKGTAAVPTLATLLSTWTIAGLLRLRTLSPIRWFLTERQLKRAATTLSLPPPVGHRIGAKRRMLTLWGTITMLFGRRFAAPPTFA